MSEAIEDLFPLYGPYDRETTVKAVYAISELTRYLNYATQEPTGLPYPVAAYDLLGGLGEALQKMPQLLDQTGQRLTAFAADPKVVDHSAPSWPADLADAHQAASGKVEQAREYLAAATAQAKELHRLLGRAQSAISGLSLPLDDEE